MQSKKKLLISLSIATAVLLIAVVAIVSISAALNQNIESNVRVNFQQSQQVIGYVSAKYSYGDVYERDMTTNGRGNGNTKVQFNYNDKQKVQTLLMRKDDLKDDVLYMNSASDSIIFEFMFRNTGYSDFIVMLDLSQITVKENIKLSYSLTPNVWVDKLPEFEVKAPVYSDKIFKTCKIKVEAANEGLNAELTGAFMWNLIAKEDM